MFARLGRVTYQGRRLVLGVMAIILLGAGAYGLGLEKETIPGGYFDDGSQSAIAARLSDSTFGRDTKGDVVVMYNAPAGTTVDDPAFYQQVRTSIEELVANNKDEIRSVPVNYFENPLAPLANPEKTVAFATLGLNGDTDAEVLDNYAAIADKFEIPGVDVQVAGLQPIAQALQDGMSADTKRAEVIALPLVGILLFFIFGGVIAAALPVIIGVLTIAGATGAMTLLAKFTEVNTFAIPVITLIGLGLAIDYGLFIVSRFREELAEGYETRDAVWRTVATAGRTVVFSATLIVTSLGGLLLFPQVFLKSVAFGAIFAVSTAALTSVTVLPAILGILGPRIDALGLKRLRRTKTKAEVLNGFWGRLTRWAMKRPALVAAPIVIGLLLLIIPFSGIKFGGLTETYLPPDNATRQAQEKFDDLFSTFRTDPVKLVITGATNQQLSLIRRDASAAPGLTGKFESAEQAKDGVSVLSAGLLDSKAPKPTLEALKAIDVPDGVQVLVGGTPALTQDSIDALINRLPMMALVVVIATIILMFLAFGSLVLPVKAVLMSALGLGSTLGVLTLIFIDGVGSGVFNFTPGPLMSAVMVLIMAIIFGLSTDYEVFLISRMIEARAQGASTEEAITIGTAQTGRIITAAALILIVVTGAFGFSDIVMMKYISYGMIAALILDATVIRMLLVPSVMKLLGEDCWWAPRWMKVLQEKIGLGEQALGDSLVPAGAAAGEPLTEPIPRITADLAPSFGGRTLSKHVPTGQTSTGQTSTGPAPIRRVASAPPRIDSSPFWVPTLPGEEAAQAEDNHRESIRRSSSAPLVPGSAPLVPGSAPGRGAARRALGTTSGRRRLENRRVANTPAANGPAAPGPAAPDRAANGAAANAAAYERGTEENGPNEPPSQDDRNGRHRAGRDRPPFNASDLLR